MDISVVLFGIGILLFLGWLVPSPISWFTRRALQKRHACEIQSLRMHLHTRMEVDALGVGQLKRENRRLGQIVQNLRFTNQVLGDKPGRAELRLLRIYERAIQVMEHEVPVFMPTWRTLVARAEAEMERIDVGRLPLLKRFFRPTSQAGELPRESAEEVKLLPRHAQCHEAKGAEAR